MLGICNGFQALIKLGLVPYGDIVALVKQYNELFNSTFNAIFNVFETIFCFSYNFFNSTFNFSPHARKLRRNRIRSCCPGTRG